MGSNNLLGIPLFIEQRLSGVLIVAKEGFETAYTPEEIELVKVVVAQAILIIECLLAFYKQSEVQPAARLMHEMYRLNNEFLTLASHELRTPLTVIKGNLQVAQRRLERLKGQITDQPEEISGALQYLQQPLVAAIQGARLQQHMIDDLIDDARIQANTFQLYRRACDLLALVKEVVTEQQRLAPTQKIVVELQPAEQEIPIIADAERIKQVLTKYLETTLFASPPNQPVTVRLTVEGEAVRVCIHDNGAGIPGEEQEHLWERFYRGRGSAVQHELDLSQGLGFYLCKVFIERHQGTVGVQSTPGQGTTFWFTLPLNATSEEKR